jgi:large subunit ribosomal protein L7/L12
VRFAVQTAIDAGTRGFESCSTHPARLQALMSNVATDTPDNIFEMLNALGVVELAQLRDRIYDEWRVAPVVHVPGTPSVPVEEQTEFTVKLVSVGGNRLDAIKLVREKLGLPLKDAKDLADAVPATLAEAVARDAAESLREAFAAIGATVKVS